VKYFFCDNDKADLQNEISFDKDFIKKTTLKNIIQCGIYDILVFDEHLKIFSNIEPLNESKEIKVDDDMLKLLQSNKFIELDNHSISNDNLVMKNIDKISLKSPLNT
jgi:hypothetical protein